MENFEQQKSVVNTQEKKEIKQAKDIFEWNPKEDSEKLWQVTKILKETYDLPEEVISNILKTLLKVKKLEITKNEVPANVVSYVWNNWKIPEKISA